MPELISLNAKNGFYAESFVISSDLSKFTELPIALRWYGFEHLNEREAIEDLGNFYGLHPLLIEDIVHQNQRPKLDDQALEQLRSLDKGNNLWDLEI
jgi:Mg2+ and Co2+ transporter CorA